jgi:hypothetical protein
LGERYDKMPFFAQKTGRLMVRQSANKKKAAGPEAAAALKSRTRYIAAPGPSGRKDGLRQMPIRGLYGFDKNGDADVTKPGRCGV